MSNKGGKGSNGGSLSKNLSPEEHNARRRATKARQRAGRGIKSGRLGITSTETLQSGIEADRKAKWQTYLDDVCEQAVIQLRRYGNNPPFGKQGSRWAPETTEMAVTLLESYFSEEAAQNTLSAQVVNAVRVAFARACLSRKVHHLPAQDEDWYAEASAKAEQLRESSRRRKTPVNA